MPLSKPYVAGAYIEAVIEIETKGRMRVPLDDEMTDLRVLKADNFTRHLVVHWPWSVHGDIDSHALYSLN